MPTSTKLMWTVLPNGGTSGNYRFSVYVSPRLDGAGSTGLLSDYSLGNWANKLSLLIASGSPFAIELGPGGPLLSTTVAPGYAANLDPALWDSAFPADNTKVTDRAFQDHSQRWIRSYRVSPLEDYIQGLYNEIAASYVDHFPDLKDNNTPVSDLLGLMARAIGLIQNALPRDREPRVPKRYEPVPQRAPATHPDAQTEAQLTNLAAQLGVSNIPIAELFRAYRFFRRGNHPMYQSKDVPYDADAVPNRPKKPEFDFHQALAALGDHPNLLRKLGLIIDLGLPHPAATLVQFPQMRLVVPPIPAIGAITPWTKHSLNAAVGFRPEARANGDLSNGALRLNDPSRFRLLQTDPDGNAIKIFDYAVNMQRHKSRLLAERAKNPQAKTSQAPEETSLPALRSGGLMVVRDARDDKSWFHLALQAQHEANPGAAILYADDVLRGFRVDVSYQGNWHSLCRWHGDIKVAGQTLQQPGPGEGYHKAESATSDSEETPPNAQKPDLYLHETVFAWRNWSLVAAVPGKTIVPHTADDKTQIEKIEHRQNEPGAGFQIASNFKAEPLSLAPLRYGEEYRFRARAVDLAGNGFAPPPSPSFPAPDPDQAPNGLGVSPPITYRRYDPVPAPMALLAAPVTWGESMEQVVIRSRADGMAAEPLPNELQLNESEIFKPTNLRWIAAPKTDVGTAEAHKAFDNLFQTPQAAYQILERESGTFNDLSVNGTQVIDVNGNVVPTNTNNDAVFPTDYVMGNPLRDGMYFIHVEDPVELPYLPDPLAHGVTFMPQDGSNSAAHRAFVGNAWPDAQPFKLILAGGPTALDMSGPDANVLLSQGTMLTVRYASAVVPPLGNGDGPPHGELEQMGRWHGMGATGQALTQAHHFQHWMLTPWRTFTFVHAVEKPLTQPQINLLKVSKGRGNTFVTVAQGLGLAHAPSTGEVELRGRWQDMVDDPAATEDEDDPHPVSKDSHVWDRKVDYDENQFEFTKRGQGPKHEFGDTKHRFVYYRFIGTTRYREYFPPKLTDYETTEVHPHDPNLTQKKKLITRPGPEYVANLEPVNILSSARPGQPDILYVLPTFKWVPTPTGRKRLGRGLRIYMRRGWFSSGVGELLGVVFMPQGQLLPSVEEELRKHVSQWGNDPIFDRNLSTPLTPAQFTHDPVYSETAPRQLGQGLLLVEGEKGPVPLFAQVLGFAPIFDTERKLWYVDLELLPTSHYYTFIRFGLCRYQPHSVSSCEISKVVQAEFAQLLADRTATLNHRSNGIDVTLAGPSGLSKLGQGNANGPAQPPGGGGRGGGGGEIAAELITPNPNAGRAHRVVAQIESRLPGSSEDLGWQVVQTVELASHTSVMSPGIVYWMGSVNWPQRNLPTDRQYRLAIREYEVYLTDPDVADETPSTGVNVMKSRLVYVDVFPLSREPGISG